MEDTIDARFTEGYDEAKQFWDDEDLDGCIEKARALLNEPAIPRYHPIKTLILLGSSLGDWQEAEDCRVRADALWRVVRRWHSEGEDAEIDVAVTELRDALNALTTALKEDQPKPYDPNCDPEANVQDLIEAEVDEAKAHQQAEEEDPEELERNDNAVLAAQEQMSKMTAESTEPASSIAPAFQMMSQDSKMLIDDEPAPRRKFRKYIPLGRRDKRSEEEKQRDWHEKQDKIRNSTSWR